MSTTLDVKKKRKQSKKRIQLQWLHPKVTRQLQTMKP